MMHEWQRARFTGTVTCSRCGLLPLSPEDCEEDCDVYLLRDAWEIAELLGNSATVYDGERMAELLIDAGLAERNPVSGGWRCWASDDEWRTVERRLVVETQGRYL